MNPVDNIIPFKLPTHVLETAAHIEQIYGQIESLVADPDFQEVVDLSTEELLRTGSAVLSVTGTPTEIEDLRGVLLSALVWIAARKPEQEVQS